MPRDDDELILDEANQDVVCCRRDCDDPAWWFARGRPYCAEHLPKKYHAQGSLLATLWGDRAYNNTAEWLINAMKSGVKYANQQDPDGG